MRRNSNHFMISALALVALLFATGCENWDPFAWAVGYHPEDENDDQYYVLRCDPTTKKFTLDIVQGDSFGHSTPDFSQIGKGCIPSTENQSRPSTMTEPVNSPAAAPPGLNGPNGDPLATRIFPFAVSSPAADATPPSLINTFPWTVPMFLPPAFPPSDGGRRRTSLCTPNLETFLVNHGTDSVTAIGICPVRVVKEIPVRSNPLQIAITPDALTAVVTSYDGAVTFIDTATNSVKGVLDLFNYNPSGIAISPDSTRAYVTHYLDLSPSLLVIDIPNRKLLSTIPLPKMYPRVVVLTPDGTQAWVNYYADRVVTIVDLLTGTVASSVDVGTQADTGMAFNATGTKAYIAVYPNQVFVVDTASLATLARLTVGQSPADVIATPDGKLWVSTETDAGVWRIDQRTSKVLGLIPLNGQTTGGTNGLMVFR